MTLRKSQYSTGHLAGAFLCIHQSVTYRDAEKTVQQEICFLTRSHHFSHDKNLFARQFQSHLCWLSQATSKASVENFELYTRTSVTSVAGGRRWSAWSSNDCKVGRWSKPPATCVTLNSKFLSQHTLTQWSLNALMSRLHLDPFSFLKRQHYTEATMSCPLQ